MGKTRRTNLQTVGLIGSIADDVNTELAFGMLHRRIGLTGRHMKAFGEEFEVVN